MLARLARAQGVSIGVDTGINACLGGSVASGVSVVFLPNGDMVVYGSFGVGLAGTSLST